MTADIPDNLECPVLCIRCHEWVELHACRHAPNCRKCDGISACSNIVCDDCFDELEAEDDT